MNINYKLDEKEIFDFILNQSTFNESAFSFDILSDGRDRIDFNNFSVINMVELIVRPECNQKCEYCYITQYGKELYPLSERLSKEQILHNIKLILEWVFNTKNLYINHWELFAGDLFYDDLYFDIIDIFAEFLRDKIDHYPYVFKKYPGLILTPSNFSFIRSPDKKERLEQYIKDFKKEFNWELGFSISTDGKYGIDTREQIPLSDDYFDALFQWSFNHPAHGFHSIISACNIDNGIKNYQWWKEQCEKWFSGTNKEEFSWLPYWLLARQDEWTRESIDKVLQLLDYMIIDRYHMCGDDIDKFAIHIFGDEELNRKNHLPSTAIISDLIHFNIKNAREMSHLQCSVNSCTAINVSNLTFPPCHRLAYELFQGGKFIVKDDKIIDIEPFNVTTYLMTKMAKADTFPLCSECEHNMICDKGCLGAQFESSGELFLPIESVCHLIKEQNYFLLWKYYNMGVINSAIQQNLLSEETQMVFSQLLDIIQNEGLNYGYIEERNVKYFKQSE